MTALLALPVVAGCGPGGGQNRDAKESGPTIAYNKSGPGPMRGPGDNSGVKTPKGLDGK